MTIDVNAPGGSAATTPGSSSTASTSGASTDLSSNYQDFLKLLTTQLQNQDPTAPADTNQLTQQIATLSSVEQQIDMNKNLQSLISLYTNSQNQNAVSYIGKQVEMDGNQGVLAGGQAAFVYDLPAGAASAQVVIKDSTGAVVFTGAGTAIAGRNQALWNGLNDTTGNTMPDGDYTFTVTAKDSAGKALDGVTTKTSGIVRSVDTDSTGTSTLSLGDISVPIAKVLSVRTPTA